MSATFVQRPWMPPGWTVMGDIIETNGRTIYENNMAIAHAIPLGTVVRASISESKDNGTVGFKGRGRFYVFAHHRDCDGTPLYAIALLKPDEKAGIGDCTDTLGDWYANENHFSSRGMFVQMVAQVRTGYAEQSLKVVTPPSTSQE